MGLSFYSDFTQVTKYDQDAANHPSWRAFVRSLHGREYGGDALRIAWCFFKDGWDAREWHRLVTAETLTVEQMLRLRAEENRSGLDRRHHIIHAIDRVMGNATIPRRTDDLQMIVDAWNARHGGKP